MKINWFPGHMHKALLDIKSKMNLVDVVIYMLDARIPLSSMNPKLSSITQGKKILYVLNKIDLADLEKIPKLEKSLLGENKMVIRFNSTKSSGEKEIVSAINALCKDKIEKYQQKGITATLRAMVIGVPNSGKSTLVNNLCKKA